MCSPIVLAAAAGLYLLPRYHQRIIVSRYTTFITRPLHQDGTPNYLAALNAIAGHGIKPGDNAAIPLLLILRPHEPALIPLWHSEVKALGVTKLMHRPSALGSLMTFFRERFPDPIEKKIPAGARGMIPLQGYMWAVQELGHDKASRVSGEELQRAERAWVVPDASVLAKYLHTNAMAIRAVRRAAALPRFFLPLVHSTRHSAHMAFAYMPWLAQVKSLSDTLLAEANLDLGENNIAECEANLIAIHRLGRLLAQEPVLIVYLVALSVDHTANKGDRILLTTPGLREQVAADYLRRLSHLPKMPKITAAITIGERMTQLDICVSFYRDIFGNPKKDPGSAEINGRFFYSFINWNPTLARINKGFDLFGQYASTPVYSRTTQQLRAAMRTMAARVKLLETGLFARLPDHVFSQILRSDRHDVVECCRLAACEKSRARLTRIGFALAAYYGLHGSYPKSLAQLCPQYLPTIPRNPLTGKPPIYIITASGYTLQAPDPFARLAGRRRVIIRRRIFLQGR
jgi:hypothetical protein